MKKIFVEPEMQRIELNLQENIATSEEISMGYYFKVSLFGCTIVETGKKVGDVTEQEAEICLVSSNARSVIYFYPREEVIPHFRR